MQDSAFSLHLWLHVLLARLRNSLSCLGCALVYCSRDFIIGSRSLFYRGRFFPGIFEMTMSKKAISKTEAAMKQRIIALPSPARAVALCGLGDFVWHKTIRPEVTSLLLRQTGDFVWGLIKANLMRRPQSRSKRLNLKLLPWRQN